MDGLLIGLTVVSLGVALVTSGVAWRASRNERRRAEARVAALRAAADLPADAYAQRPAGDAPVDTTPSIAREPQVTAGGLESFASQPPAPVVAMQTGFLGTEEPVRPSGAHQHWLAAAAAVVAVVLGGFVLVRMTGAPATAEATAAPAPLELLSLRHEREGVNLSVAGLVRNPPLAPMAERLVAVVFLFDQQGTFVTSAKAPIDFVKLASGDESPFVVKVAAPQSVARYRVSFRTEAGTVPHVDRRGEPPIATPVALTR